MRFETHKISDLIDEISMGPFGSNIKVECFVAEGIPVLNGSNLEGYKLVEDTFRYVTEEKADSLGKANAHRGDIVITHRGTLGQIVYIPLNSKHDRYVISQSQFRVKCNSKVLPEYLVYYFHTREGQYKLLSNASQVGVPALARASTTFQKIEVPIPAVEEQKRVVAILDALQNKLELNNAINHNLQQQALAIYRELSKGEPTHCLGDLIVEMPKSKIKVGDAKDIKGEYPFFTSGKAVLAYPNALVSGRKIYLNTGGNADVKFYIGDAAYSTDTWCIEGRTWSTDYLYLALVDLLPEIEQTCFEGSALRHLQKGKLKSLPVYIPTTEERTSLLFAVKALLDQQSRNIQENKRMAALRDTLLPKLMNGEIDVSDVEV